jgi:alkylation response protein AidB-like acyl-CoA dehydrogenase
VLLQAVRDSAEAVAAGADEAEKNTTLPMSAVQAMQDAGLFRLKMAAELGGADADPVTQMEVIEALTAIYPSAGWVLMTNATAIGNASAFLDDEAIEEVFADGEVPRAATVGGVSSTIEPTDGGYILNGRWPFCSGVPHSEWICLGARLYKDAGAPPDIYTCFVRTNDVTIIDNWQVAGLRGSGSNDVQDENLFVPEHFTWPRYDRARCIRRRGGPIFLLGLPGSVSNEHASFALGVGRLALDTVKEIAMTKRRGRGPAAGTLANRQVFQRFVGEAELRLRSARMVTFEVHERAWEVACEGVMPDPAPEAEMRASAVYCTEVAASIATQAFRFGGGEALHLENKLQMCMRDINAGAQHLAVSDVAYENLGQFYLDLPEANPYY